MTLAGDAPALIAGVDEAGRGPLAGPVVAAAVILNPAAGISGLADSKTLSEAQRTRLAGLIRERALGWALGRAEPWEIDQLNVLNATLLAMRRAIAALEARPARVLVDGDHCPRSGCPETALGKGDQTEPCISAASILAKCARDAEMAALARRYPGYGFERHKGYPTPQHRQALARLGPCPSHRRSFAPVRRQAAAAAARQP